MFGVVRSATSDPLSAATSATLALVLPMSTTATMRGSTPPCREGLGVGESPGRGVCGGPPSLTLPRKGGGDGGSEIEVVDVVLGVNERRPEQNLAAVDDRELPEPAGLQFLRFRR